MWCLPWRCMEATWASSRVQCSSLSLSPGWTRWSWATPTPCASGRNRNHHAKAQAWAKAPAQARRLKPMYPTRSPPPPPTSRWLSTEKTPETNLKLRFPFLPSALVLVSRPPPHFFRPFHTGTEGPPCPAVLWETSGIAAAFLTHHLLFADSPSAVRLWAGKRTLLICVNKKVNGAQGAVYGNGSQSLCVSDFCNHQHLTVC